ncbi:MAG: tRNA pseudouridine(55) synthase TruB [Candidatus Berkiellales bacterium]
MPRENIDGILLLDKPLGVTSNGALQKVKYLFNAIKAGHTGSLDPLACGMLPICFGKATKLSHFMLEANKCYQFTISLGVTTTTGDSEGEILATKPVPPLSDNDLAALVSHFHGTHQQIPPMYSALKYHGQPLYKLARQGKSVVRAARTITISRLTLDNLERAQNINLTFTVECSKGTYIRTLAEDMGAFLNCGAHVQQLRRLWSAPFQEFPMTTLPILEVLPLDLRLQYLLPLPKAQEFFAKKVESVHEAL